MNKITKKCHYFFLSSIFFNTFLDLGHKILIQNTFFQTSNAKTYTVMSAIVNALILLPYIFFFSPSGFIADKFAKAKVLRITAIAAIPLTILITWFYFLGWFWCAFSMTILLAIQSAINSPAKYGYIKELFGEERIALANGCVQTIIIIAILAGTLLFSILFQYTINKHGINDLNIVNKAAIIKKIAPIGFFLILSSCLESILTFFIPVKQAVDPEASFSLKQYTKLHYVKTNVKSMLSSKTIFTCIVALSIFWGINQVILANYGSYLKQYMPGTSVVFAQGSLATGGIGILLGALYAGYISKNFIETGIIPIAVVGIATGLFLMPMIHTKYIICLVFLTYGIFCGMLIVPLNSLIQFIAPDNKLGRILAGNNFTQNIVMILFLVCTAFLALLNINTIIIFRILFMISFVAAIYSILKLPQSLTRYFTFLLISKIYKIKASGIENIPASKGALLLGNHTSYLDWAILQITSPRPIRFVMERTIYNKWYLRWILKHLKAIPISNKGSKHSLESIRHALQQGDLVALFPEGFLSRNGQLGKFNHGFELAIKDTNALIIPFYIRGLWGSCFSHAKKQHRSTLKNKRRKIEIYYGKTLPNDTTVAKLKTTIHQLSYKAWKDYAETLPTIPEAWLTRAKIMRNKIIAMDNDGKKINSYEAISLFLAFKKLFKSTFTKSTENIGIILPPSIAGAITNLALLSIHKSVVNLNYTSPINTLLYSIKKSDIKTIITSRTFIRKLEKKGINFENLFKESRVIYLEDNKKSFSKINLFFNKLLAKYLPTILLKSLFIQKTNPNNTAIIYFSSGSEGKPKGVKLTHKNILTNSKQVAAIISAQNDDIVLGCLPLFHAFGLTITTLMPLLEGIPVVFHPDPTDAVGIGKTIAKFKTTILCSTSTFLNLYVRHPKVYTPMFKSLRLVIAGAEKLSPQVADAFRKKFGINILEGYGATETAPAVTVSIPDILIQEHWHIQTGNKPGSVGMPLPGTSIKIINPDTHETLTWNQKGLVAVAGPQVMQGYLNDPEKTSEVLITTEGITWYLTGDQGYLDEDGFLTITDRYSRFAKIGGEMISLTAVENAIKPALSTDQECVALAVPDPKKGEKIILLFTESKNTTFDLNTIKKNVSLNPLMLPAECFAVSSIPKLGSGKTDLATCKKIILEKFF